MELNGRTSPADAAPRRASVRARARRTYDPIMDDSPARPATFSERLGADAPDLERAGVGLIACYPHSRLRPQAAVPYTLTPSGGCTRFVAW